MADHRRGRRVSTARQAGAAGGRLALEKRAAAPGSRTSRLPKAGLALRQVPLDLVGGQPPHLRARVLPVLVDNEGGGHPLARLPFVPPQIEPEVLAVREDRL